MLPKTSLIEINDTQTKLTRIQNLYSKCINHIMAPSTHAEFARIYYIFKLSWKPHTLRCSDISVIYRNFFHRQSFRMWMWMLCVYPHSRIISHFTITFVLFAFVDSICSSSTDRTTNTTQTIQSLLTNSLISWHITNKPKDDIFAIKAKYTQRLNIQCIRRSAPALSDSVTFALWFG